MPASCGGALQPGASSAEQAMLCTKGRPLALRACSLPRTSLNLHAHLGGTRLCFPALQAGAGQLAVPCGQLVDPAPPQLGRTAC